MPFDGDSAVTIALKHVSEAPQPPSRFNPRVTPELEQTVLWTLNKNPADRPADAEQLITVLEHCREAIVAGRAGEHTASMAAVAAGAAAGLPVEGMQQLQPQPMPDPEGSTNGSGEILAVIEAEPEEPERRRRWLPWVLAAAVVLLVAGAAAAAYFLSRPKQRVVPPVVGQTVQVAKAILGNQGLQAAQVKKHSNQPVGIVIDADPSVGSKVDKGSTITLTVSTGRSSVIVPNVQGESQKGATAALKKKGLKVTRVVPTSSSSVPDAQAIKTSPAAAQSVPRNTDVTLFMSTGPPLQKVPGVVGDSEAAASSTLSGAGFNPSTHTEVTSSAPAGTVVSQDPGPGESATAGSTVTITIARAPAKATMPTVTGATAAQAQAAIRAAGLVPQVNYRPQAKPDYVILWGFGVMNPVALKAAAKLGYPRDKILGVWWAGSEEDVISAGDAAKGYVSAAFSAPGTNFPVMQDIKNKLDAARQRQSRGQGPPGQHLSHARRRLRNHHRRGDPHGAGQVRQGQGDDARAGSWGVEHLNLSEARIKELGAAGMFPPIKTSCLDHEGRAW